MLILRKEECDRKTKSKTDGLHREVIPLEHCLRLKIKMVKIRKCLKAFQKGSKHLLTLEKSSKKKRDFGPFPPFSFIFTSPIVFIGSKCTT